MKAGSAVAGRGGGSAGGLRILVVTPCLPYAGVRHAGGKLVHFLVEELAARHEVTLVARFFPGEEERAEELREQFPASEMIPGPGILREGSLGSLLRSAASIRRLARRAGRRLAGGGFDICQVEFTEVGVFWPRSTPTPSFLSCHDVWVKPATRRLAAAGGVARILGAFSRWMLVQAERRALERFHGVFTLSEEDRGWAERFYPGISASVLHYPGGVGFTGLPRQERPGRVAYLGTLNRSANVEGVQFLVQEVWPRVLARAPDAELVIAGVGASEELARELRDRTGVRFLGAVDSPEELYRSASVFAAPVLVGGGVIVKVLDALAAGVATVTTSRGNEGIGAKPGRDLLVADKAEEFAEAVIALLADPAWRQEMAAAGQTFILRERSPGRLVEHLESEYRAALWPSSGP